MPFLVGDEISGHADAVIVIIELYVPIAEMHGQMDGAGAAIREGVFYAIRRKLVDRHAERARYIEGCLYLIRLYYELYVGPDAAALKREVYYGIEIRT